VNIKSLADRLEEQGMGQVGRDIFYFSAPEGIGECLLVLDNLEPTTRDEELPGFKESRFRVIVRRLDYDVAISTAKNVIVAMEMRRGAIGDMSVKRLRAEFDPIAYPLPMSDMIEVSVNFCAYYVEPDA
jgi:hypothetical protein